MILAPTTSFLPDASTWALVTGVSPLRLYGVEHIKSSGYNDEEHFVASLTIVEASYETQLFHIPFQTERRFGVSPARAIRASRAVRIDGL